MICHQCNQDSIKIVMEDEIVHIRCDICGLDIRYGTDNSFLCDLFIYNENLHEAELLGQEAFTEGKKLEDNPYLTSSSQIILNKKWELGYTKEQESYELSALSLSSEKIQNSLQDQINILKDKEEQLHHKIDSFISENYNKIRDFCDKLLSIKVLGIFLKKRINKFIIEYTRYYNEKWDYSL